MMKENKTLLHVEIGGAFGSATSAAKPAFEAAKEALNLLLKGKGAGRDCLGWLDLPDTFPEETLAAIQDCAKDLSSRCDYVICIGIGGSYLGAKALLAALKPPFKQTDDLSPEILFAGQHIGEDYLVSLLTFLGDKSFGIVVISKSGTTTEPAIAFRLLKKLLIEKVGQLEASQRIVAITDPEEGALRQMAQEEEYKTFAIPKNIGGRFSVLTPVGLLPLALAGLDIRALLGGAREMRRQISDRNSRSEENPVIQYAAARYVLYQQQGKKIELLASFTPELRYLGEWWQQLFAESEGKSGKGLFPVTASFTTDLHSLGQWIQEGERILFETFLLVPRARLSTVVSFEQHDGDGLNYLAGKSLSFINEKACRGTMQAHREGGVPIIEITLSALDERALGALVFFFEAAVAVSGYLIGVNPFDQPGVEAYKRNMFALLEKPSV